jgi:hypothetical protein
VNREIKFRPWDSGNGRWYDWEADDSPFEFERMHPKDDLYLIMKPWLAEGLVLMQYTVFKIAITARYMRATSCAVVSHLQAKARHPTTPSGAWRGRSALGPTSSMTKEPTT